MIDSACSKLADLLAQNELFFGSGQYHGKNHLEVMGQKNFRQILNITDGSPVEVQVDGDDAWWRSGK